MKIGIFYGSSTGNAELIADRLQVEFGEENADVHNIDAADKAEVEQYDYLIFGTSTWGIGDMQDDWEDFSDDLKEIDLSSKKVALYGLGDQEVYADSFVDGMGHLYNLIAKNTTIVGEWPAKDYRHSESIAVKKGKFVGLAIDYDNEKGKVEQQIIDWVKQLKNDFK